jgi:flavin-dependent dehydrogenase
VAVLGAGPSGCAAALRLLAVGHQVALIERLPFPRRQIGESISPGVWAILDFLEATATLGEAAYLKDVPARVAWEDREPTLIPPSARGPGVMVDRGDFDARLLALAARRGALVIQPARAKRIEGEPGDWTMPLTGPAGEFRLGARLIIDARGRGTASERTRRPLNAATHALWSHIDGGLLSRETRIEAIDRAWLWGAPIPDGRYRVMAFLDTATLKQAEEAQGLFRRLVARGVLFEAAATARLSSPLQACPATPYIDLESWAPGLIKVGECALALDPLSSSGVEVSMRLALQAVIAANTVLRDPDSAPLARQFYEARLFESAATHSTWTRSYYGRAWPGPDHAFWRDRSTPLAAGVGRRPDVAARPLEADVGQAAPVSGRLTEDDGRRRTGTISAATPVALSTAAVSLSPDLRFIEIACAVGDIIQLRWAIVHPNLERSVAFLEGTEIAPLLRLAPSARDFSQLLALWAAVIPAATAIRIAVWLVQKGILRPESGGDF